MIRYPRRYSSRATRLRQSGKVWKNERGQLVVEYVLLLIVAIVAAMVLTVALVNREDGNEGFVIAKWKQMLQVIAGDSSDDIQR